MNALQQHAFETLLASWRRREDARRSGSIRALADARTQLDDARMQARAASIGR
jgi:hypothetical protein